MPQNYFYSYSEAMRAEEAIPSMTYAALVRGLGWLTDIGVLREQNPVAMLVAARIVDRDRIRRSGMTTGELLRALEEYRAHRWAVTGIVKALEQAVEKSRG